MRYPSYLKQGQTLGFPAPSFGCNEEPYKSAFVNALEVFKAKGFGVKPGPNAFSGAGIGISNTPQACGRELTDMMLDPAVDAVISCGGGELMCEILDHVDFAAIAKADPKWYMGYSDNTNFTFLLATLCDTASIYAPCAPAFGMEPWHPAVGDAFDLLQGKKLSVGNYPRYQLESLKDEENPLVPYNDTEESRIRAWLPGRGLLDAETAIPETVLEGRLLGGCIDILVNLTGTCYDRTAEFAERYRDDGVIWFLEACDLTVFSIRRAMWHMDHAGWFRNVKGFLIGRPLCMGQEIMGLDQYRAVTDILGKYNVPILMDLDIGHLPPMMPVMSGGTAKITMKEQTLSVNYTCR